MKNNNKAMVIAQSVKAMLDDTFNILSDTKAINANEIHVRVLDKYADYVKKLLEVNYCESLVFVMEATADEVTTLTYFC